jgi:zinc protease
MRFRLTIAAVALLALAGASAPLLPAPAARLAHEPVLLLVPADPTISVKLAFTVGSEDDPPGKEGLAYLTATLMAEGATRKHPYPEILRLLYPMAAGYSVRVDKELTAFSGRVHKDNLDAYTALLLDAVLEPAFDQADFTRLKQRTRDFITKTLRYSSDEELGKQTFYNAVFRGTPYGHLEAGTVAGLDAITLEDVKGFYAAHFTREDVVLAVGGGYDAKLVDRLQAALAQLPAGKPAPVPAPQLRPVAGRPVVIVKKPGPATAISFGHPIAAKRGTREFYALWLANSWLGEHRNSSSHLYQVIRDARGMNYGDYSYIEIFPDGGRRQMPPTNVPRRQQLFEVWIRPVPNDQAHFALRAAVCEVEKLAKNGLTKEQFELTREFLSKYCLHFAETTDDRLGYALDDRLEGVAPPGDLEDFRRIVPTLTLDEVNAAVKKHLRPENMCFALVSEKADSLADQLAAGTPSPMTYATPKPPEVLAEDKQFEIYPLGIRRELITVIPVDQMFAQ